MFFLSVVFQFFLSSHLFTTCLHPEEIQQSKGEESPPSGGEGSHGRRLCQGGRSQQGNLQGSHPHLCGPELC